MKLYAFAMVSVFATSLAVAAQTPVPVDNAMQVELHGSVSVLAQPQFDRGVVADGFPVRRALVMLQPSPERESALQRFLREAHSPDSANYHKWLTPEQYGARFGATDDDIAAVTGWLEASGFTVARVTKSKAMIEFSGTAAQVRSALHTEIHQYEAAGRSFYSNDRAIAVPAAIAARIRNFAPLNSVAPTSYVSVAGRGMISRKTHRVIGVARVSGVNASGQPEFTTTAKNAPFYALAPEDFATQYDLGPVYSAGTKGDGQTIGVIGTANLNLALVDAYRKLFNLSADHTNVIVDGEDPGDGLAPDVEGFLDVEASGAVAPDAAINYYIAGGQPLANNLALAALRAIEDNEAPVLSVSYGECEQLLGNAGNQLWNGLWQQAAAQGQTVLVASGDSGPNACPAVGIISSTGTITSFELGISVSGITSTPWNVSVGGTDFYYSDYATGGASAATLWDQTNDSSDGSLKAPLAEQPWNDELGFNAVASQSNGLTAPVGAATGVGGGGASNCSDTTPGSATTLPGCVAGYTKPAWQQGPGVPADGVRDLPDISLFAANGFNYSAWPICAEAGDCTGSSPEVYLVGGTSSSTPAMAGIMALVNQKYGRQGQADYTLYALAQQQASSFHDISIGTNDVLCTTDTPDCTGAPPPQFGPYAGTYGVYAAGAGYDQATGLGSVDASLLLANWNKITTTATATSLQLSQATAVHGTPLAATATVKASSGSGMPTGEVVLETSPAASLRGNGLLTLSGGTASGNVATLPGGTYSVVAQYGGDGVFAPSTSSPVSVTVTPEPSATNVTLDQTAPVEIEGNLVLSQATLIANGGQGVFGSRFSFLASPIGQTSGFSGLATGTATFTDGSTSVTLPLGANGSAGWVPQTLALGAHSVTVSYSGDASYAASTSVPLTFTVVKGTPIVAPVIEEEFQSVSCPPTGGECTQDYAAGSSPYIHVLLRAPYANVPPTGTVTVSLGSISQTATVTTNTYLNENLATADVTLSNVPAGNYTFTVSYSGDGNWNASTYTAPVSFAAVTSSSPVATTTTALTVTPASASSSDLVSFNVTVTASSTENGFGPIGEVVLLANGSVIASGAFAVGPSTAQSPTQSLTLQVPASEIPVGAQQVIALYPGNFGFAASTSAPVSLAVSDSEFTLASGTTSIAVGAGKAVTAPLMLGTGYGLTVPVALTCATSSPSFTCSISPSSISISTSGAATLTINAFTTAAAVAGVANPASVRFVTAEGIVAFACVVMLGLPGRRRRWPLQCLLMLAIGVSLIGCGGSGSSGGSGNPPSNPVTNTKAGTYSVVVRGVSGGVTHNVKVDVIVQ